MRQRVIGVLGGMGPEATADLFLKIIRRTRAGRDCDHLRVIIDSNPAIPDRTRAIQGTGPSPVPELVRSARALERAGADFIVIPCVTAHYFHGALAPRTTLPVLHIVEETAHWIRRNLTARAVGVLASTGTIETGLFQRALAKQNIESIVPLPDEQSRLVMEAIYGRRGIKAAGASAYAARLVARAAERLVGRGARAILAGCTELPLVLRDGDLTVPVVDPVLVLAEAAIRRAGGARRLRPVARTASKARCV
jgi:aspartate racemase